MGKKYDLVKRYYDQGLWSEKRVRDAVIKGWITEEGYKAIIGEKHAEEG